AASTPEKPPQHRGAQCAPGRGQPVDRSLPSLADRTFDRRRKSIRDPPDRTPTARNIDRKRNTASLNLATYRPLAGLRSGQVGRRSQGGWGHQGATADRICLSSVAKDATSAIQSQLEDRDFHQSSNALLRFDRAEHDESITAPRVALPIECLTLRGPGLRERA